MRAALIAPISSSPLALVVAARCLREPGVELCGLIVRDITLGRMRSEFRRDGATLLRKAWRAFFLGEHQKFAEERPATEVETSSLDALALRDHVPLVRAGDINAANVAAFLKSVRPDVVVFTGGGLLRSPILDAAGRGVLNAHMGILPQYRGMDVMKWPLLERQEPAEWLGVTLHFMDSGVDTGPILATRRVAVEPLNSIESLNDRYLATMADLLLDGVRMVRDGRLEPRPQQPGDGRQYFVMHPRLSEIAADRLRSLGGAGVADD